MENLMVRIYYIFLVGAYGAMFVMLFFWHANQEDPYSISVLAACGCVLLKEFSINFYRLYKVFR